MNNDTIEKKDRQLLLKVRRIIHQKETKGLKISLSAKILRIGLPVLITSAIVAGLMILNPPPSSTTAPPQAPASEQAGLMQNTAGQNKKINAAAAAQIPDPPSPLSSDGHPAPEIHGTEPSFLASSPQAAVSVDPSPLPRKPEPPLTVESSAGTDGIRISGLSTCDGVSDRQCKTPRAVFRLSETPNPVVWMTVWSDAYPFKLRHVYYANGQKYCEIPLKVSHPRMRTWSHVTLSRKGHLGSWRVDVVTEKGALLDQIEFTVVP